MLLWCLLRVVFGMRDDSCTFMNIKWNMYHIDECIVTEKEDKNMPKLTSVTRKKKSNTYSSILVSLFKGHTSIPWIQISIGKAYQSNFPPLSIEANQTEIDHVKSYFIPPFCDLWRSGKQTALCSVDITLRVRQVGKKRTDYMINTL